MTAVTKHREKLKRKMKQDESLKRSYSLLHNRSNRNAYKKSSTKNNPNLALKRYRSIGRKLNTSYILENMCSMEHSAYKCDLDKLRREFRGKIRTYGNKEFYDAMENFIEFVRLHMEYDFVPLEEGTQEIHATLFGKFCVIDLPQKPSDFERTFLVHEKKLYHFDFRNVKPNEELDIEIVYTKRCNPENFKEIQLSIWLKDYGYSIDTMKEDFMSENSDD